jgi:magnesium-transporting ATPase (P-type)
LVPGAPGTSGPARPAGLTTADAADRTRSEGPNVLPSPPSVPAWKQLARQLVHSFAAMLWIAGVLAILAGLPALGIAIFAVIVLNGVFAFVQEHRAEHAARRLRDLLPRRATVIRDGVRHEIDAAQLVVDDLVVLNAGDRVSADLVAAEVHGLRVDTSTLTGESVPIAVEVGEPLFAGTFVIEGEALATVQAIGANTRLASIALLTGESHRPPSPLARELHRVVRTIAVVAVGVGLGFFVLSVAVGTDATDGFLLAIGVTVALVPEGLLPTVTLALAIGAQRMAQQHALVRHLEAVETLGSTTFICTDKTGTLTENRMAVVELWTPAGSATVTGEGYDPEGTIDAANDDARSAVTVLALAAARCSAGRAVLRDGQWIAAGDPMEAALDVLARRAGVDVAGDEAAAPVRRRFPFDPRRRRMSVVAGTRLLVKGAPDAVLPRCSTSSAARDVERAQEAVDAMTAQGRRVLAIAARDVGPDDGEVDVDGDAAERDLTLLGLVALEDPPRAHAAAALAACRRAGMRVAMVTGDHPATAAAVAAEVGLLLPGGMVVEGHDLPEDEQLLGALVDRDGIVLARVDPADKLRIARALRARGHVVAMTGDGVNDGPALQEADIGVAMGRSGTDVAREAADIVLLDDDFATIVTAIEQGRAAFSNVRRFLTYHLTDNVAELTPFLVWALSGGRFPLAIGVLQVLALDVGTDTLPAIALGAEPPAPHTLDQRPARGPLLDRTVARRAFGVLGPTEALVALAAFVATFLASGWRIGDDFPTGDTLLAASGAAFAAIVLGQMANALACRSSRRPALGRGWPPSALLRLAIAVELTLLVAFLGIPPLASLLDHAPPSAAGAAVAVLAPPAVLAADALDKRHRARHRRS